MSKHFCYALGTCLQLNTIYIDVAEEKKRKEMPVSKYRHESEPVGLVLITVFRDAT
jgi:hypothetical protein